jgi:hypothetical protein
MYGIEEMYVPTHVYYIQLESTKLFQVDMVEYKLWYEVSGNCANNGLQTCAPEI